MKQELAAPVVGCAPPEGGAQQQGFVGSHLDVIPGISAAGLFVRISRLNLLGPSDYSALTGGGRGALDCLMQVLNRSHTRQQQFATTLGLAQSPATWSLEMWHPFQARRFVEDGKRGLRYCPTCIRSGYHTLLHDLPWFALCPWHDARLRDGCERCDQPILVTSHDWVRGQRPLRCRCGHDHFDLDYALTHSPTNADKIRSSLNVYLAWASEERQRTTLIPAESHDARELFNRLFELPAVLRSFRSPSRLPAGVLRALSPKSRGIDEAEASVAFAQIDKLRFGNLDALRIPDSMRRLAIAASRLTAAKRPGDRNLPFLLGCPPEELDSLNYLNVAYVPLPVVDTIAALLDNFLGMEVERDRSHHVGAEDTLVLRTVRHLLCRGFAIGLNSALQTDGSRPRRLKYGGPRPSVLIRRSLDASPLVQVLWQQPDAS